MKLDRRLMVIAAGVAGLAATGSFEPANAQDRGGGARGLHGAAPARAHAGHASPGRGDPGHADRGRHVDGAHAGHSNPDRGRDRRATDVGVGVNVDVPLTYDAYASGGRSCRSLRMRAEVTGSGYWWGRYQACLDGRDDY